MKTIFKNEVLHVFYYPSRDCVFVRCAAKNPVDGKDYEKTAGWISKSLCFHQCNRAPKYIFDAACSLIRANRPEIFQGVVSVYKLKL
jgi:hypothetical protein